MNGIKQIKGFETRSYEVDPGLEFVEADYKSIKDRIKYKIYLTEIGNEIQYEAENPLTNPHRIFSLFFAIAAFSCLIVPFVEIQANPILFVFLGILMSVLSFVGFVQPIKDDIIIINGSKPVRLFRSKPNEEEVMKFAQNLIKIANSKKKELLINFDLNEEQFTGNIQWLLHMKLIDKSEFQELKSEYKLKKLL